MPKKKVLIITSFLIITLFIAVLFVLKLKEGAKEADSVDFGPKSVLTDSQNKMMLKYPESMDVYDTYLNTEEGTKDIFFKFKEDGSPEPVGLILRIRKDLNFTGFSQYCEEQKNTEISEECLNTESSEENPAQPLCEFPEFWCDPQASFSIRKINGIKWEVPGDRSVVTRNGEIVLYSVTKDGKVYTMMSRSDSPVYLEGARQIVESVRFSSK